MWKSLLKLSATLVLSVSYMANAGVVVESTRYLYKEGAREISAQYENKDDTPYLMKSWIEPPEGASNSYFMVTPPLFRLEAKQRNTVRVFLTLISQTHRRIVTHFISSTLCRFHHRAIALMAKIRCNWQCVTE